MNAYNYINKHFDRNESGQIITPDLSDFIAEFTAQDSFTTPEGNVEPNDLLEDICLSNRQIKHNDIQMDALKGELLSDADAAAKWRGLVALMNAAASDFYNSNIVPDYQGGDL
tara:strand:- start:190 stop:528 length:339 start_codon:yes stop_codon:yes gene_type:complete